MGAAYTPGLRISPFTHVRTTRRLPIRGDVLVRNGAVVEPATIVARAELPGLLQTVKVGAQLGLEPSEVAKHLAVRLGDRVEAGQLVAQTQSFFGMFKSACKAPIEGTIEIVSEVSGNVGIRAHPIPIELNAYLRGTIVEVLPADGVVIETEGAFIQGIFGVGGERQGEIRIASRSAGDD